MAGYFAYLLIVAVPAYLLALYRPFAAYSWVALLLIGSVVRVVQNANNEKERKSFWYMALPCYLFAVLMIRLWF